MVVVGVLYSVESYILKENDLGGIFCEEKKEYKTGVQDVFLERKDGTYTYAEMIYPKKYEGAMPLVVIGHGFKGNLNSGGARGTFAEAGSFRNCSDPYGFQSKSCTRSRCQKDWML